MTKRAKVLGPGVTIALAILALGATPAWAGGKTVVYTVSATSLGDPVPGFPSGGGGPLFADGTARGQFGVSFGNGENVQLAVVSSWEPVGTDAIAACIDVHTVKGEFPDFTFCTQAGVTGTPAFLDFDGDGTTDAIVRITPAN